MVRLLAEWCDTKSKRKVGWVSIPASSVLRVSPHWKVVMQRNSLSVDDNIYLPPWGLSTQAKEFLATAHIMQSSSNELSTLVSGKV